MRIHNKNLRVLSLNSLWLRFAGNFGWKLEKNFQCLRNRWFRPQKEEVKLVKGIRLIWGFELNVEY
jgi:hypothetical protein